jgi:hypothetical protein
MSETPQFGTAEYQPQLSGESCKTCGTPISGQYFLVNGVITCWDCAQKTEASVPQDSHAAFSRGILFGIGGAILGLILYSVVGIVTGLEIGYVSLAVGYIVGRALLLGTSGVGGRRHQIAAAMLTYAAVSMSAVPMYIWSMQQDRSEKPAISSSETAPVDAEAAAEPEEEVAVEETTADSAAANESSPGLVGSLIFMAVLGLASPILGLMSPLNGLIGLVILFVGIRIAWTMTAGNAVEIAGPFNA